MPTSRKPVKRRSTKRGGSIRKLIIAFAGLMILTFGITGMYYYGRIFSPNLILETGEPSWLYIRSTDTFSDVLKQLNQKKLLRNAEAFVWMAGFTGYDQHVKPGRYKIRHGMNNRELVNLLKSGAQEPLRITLQAMRKPEQVAGKIGRLLESDSLVVMSRLRDQTFLSKYGLHPESALGLFIPDTYTFYWNTPADSFLNYMGRIYLEFWNSSRREQASRMQLSLEKVIILASIVQQESNKQEEWPVIAGVYLNRLRRGMKLQADPTVKFAAGRYDMRRVRGILDTNSPYNTYRVHGLPPGPIYMPSKKCLDSVLQASSHGFLFFCASPDKPGYHSFAKTWTEHEINARKYRRYLDARGIK
jgi:UPF0755 protein